VKCVSVAQQLWRGDMTAEIDMAYASNIIRVSAT